MERQSGWGEAAAAAGREGEPGGSTMPFSAFEAGNTRKFAPTHAA